MSCIEKGYLKDIIEEGELIMDYKSHLFDYAEQLKTEGWEEGLEQGIEQGIEQGLEQGHAEGAIKLAEFIKAGLSVDDALVRVQSELKIAV